MTYLFSQRVNSGLQIIGKAIAMLTYLDIWK